MRTEPSHPGLKLLALAAGSALAVVVACTLPAGDFAGRTCSVQLDCPEPYACVAIQPGALRTCELLELPRRSDAGPPSYDGGGVFYCAQAKPILDTYCVNCHGPTQQNGGNFRLDRYESVGGVPGARAQASRIMDRAVLTNSMPPPNTTTGAPTEEERHALGVWVTAGAPLCDGGTP
jgi:mono/diheme cytochrome c family protein